MSVYLDTELGIPLDRREPAASAAFRDAVGPDDVVYDLGANIGFYTLLAADATNAQVHAFEPHPANVLRLEDTVRINGLDARVYVVDRAVAAVSGTVDLLERETDTMHTVVEDDREGTTVSVEAVTLDGYASEEGIERPNLVKVDVEGAAGEVFAGAADLIAATTATWIVELHSEGEREAFDDAFRDAYVIEPISDRHYLARP